MHARALAALGAGVLVLTAASPAQDQEHFIAERAKKLAKPIFQKAHWIFDYDQAREEAKKQGVLLFAYFTRSYTY